MFFQKNYNLLIVTKLNIADKIINKYKNNKYKKF